MARTAHLDTFTRDNLPPREEWPELLFELPELQYPERLNCAAELLDGMVTAGHGARVALREPGIAFTYRQVLERSNRIASVLRASRDYGGLFDEWFYWAPGKESRTEVDFLLRRGKALVAVEVKASRQVPDNSLRGLRAVAEVPGLRRQVVCLGARPMQTEDGIEILPLEHFLHEVESGALL